MNHQWLGECANKTQAFPLDLIEPIEPWVLGRGCVDWFNKRAIEPAVLTPFACAKKIVGFHPPSFYW